MSINWLNDSTYQNNSIPKKLDVCDLAGGIGIFTIEVGCMVEYLITYLVNNQYLTKNQAKTARTNSFMESKGDALQSTLGPIIEKMKQSGVAYAKDLEVLPNILNERNYFQHQFVHNYLINNGSMDLRKAALRLIKNINDVCSINRRYIHLNNQYAEKMKKIEKKNAERKIKKENKVHKTNYSREQLVNIIKDIIRNNSDDEGRAYNSLIGQKLNEKGIYHKDYGYTKLTDMLKDLNLKCN